MGVASALIGGALLGLGVSAMGKQSQNNYGNMNDVNLDYKNVVSSMPTVPQAPTSPDGDGTKSDAMLAAEEEERKKRAAEAEANKTNHTTGLGITSNATIDRKTLLG